MYTKNLHFDALLCINKKCKTLTMMILQCFAFFCKIFSGERGIRTPGPVTVNGFQDRRIRPLCHLSNGVQKYAFALSFAKELGKLMVFYFDNLNLVDIPNLKALKESELFDIWYTI